MSSMQIHSQRHAELEIQYLQEKGKLDDEMSRVASQTFAAKADVEKWKDSFQQQAQPVFDPLQQYFSQRAVGQKLLMVSGLAPLGLGAFSALTAGFTSGNLILGGIGLGIMLVAQSGLAKTYNELGGLMADRAEVVRDSERLAQYKCTEIDQKAATPPPPAQLSLDFNAPVAQPAAVAPPPAQPAAAS